jgi:glycosyltransferase involved in cell wall biosynthesis
MLTYNRETLVSNAIDSVLTQTFHNFEFIIVDNGSTDRSGAIADEYAVKDPRIRVIHKARGNIGSGRNAGLDAAIGEWIAFVDDDDYCEPDFLEFLYGLAVENEADVAICGAAHRTFPKHRVMSAEDAVVQLLWRKLYSVAFPTKLIKREIFTLRFSETARYDDIELMANVLANANRIAYDGASKYTFERNLPEHNSQWSRNPSLLDQKTLDEYLDVYTSRTAWLCERFPNNVTLWRYFEWSFMLSMIDKITRYNLTDCYARRQSMLGALSANRATFERCGYLQAFEKEWLETYVCP